MQSPQAAVADLCRALVAETLTFGRITFRTGSAELDPASEPVLQRLGDVLGLCADVRVTVEGHTDNVGNAAANQTLSQRRAQSVVTDLVDRGVARDRISASGFGDTRPVATNDTAEGRAQNRRIEFVLE